MPSRALSIAAALLLLAIVPVTAQVTVIPKCTVIPVYLENGLNSAVSQPGDCFYARCCEGDCGGFPANTRFVGRVTNVTPRTDCVPGQMMVVFTQAILPDNTVVNINGAATSFAGYHAAMDSNGRRIATEEGRSPDNRFIGYCQSSVVLGTVVGDCIRGGAISQNCEWVENLKLGGKMPAANVNLPPKTSFGIVLLDDAPLVACANQTIPQIETPSSGAGPEAAVRQYRIAFPAQQPLALQSGTLMVPFRAVMNGVNVPFVYEPDSKAIVINYDGNTARHAAGTNVLRVNDEVYTLSTYSELSPEGVLFVPADMIELLTGRSAKWHQDLGVLTLD